MHRSRLDPCACTSIAAAIAFLAACEPARPTVPPVVLVDAGKVASDTVAEVKPDDPDVGLLVDGSRAPGVAHLKGKIRIAKDFPNQIDGGLKSYATSGGKLQKGDLWLQLCADVHCHDVQHSVKVLDQYAFTSTAKDIEAPALPVGTFHARFGLDTAYSQGLDGSVAQSGAFGPFDVLQAAGVDPKPSVGFNLPGGSKPVTLAADVTVDVGEVVLGKLIVSDPAFAAKPEAAWLVAAISGPASFRNQIRVLDLDTYTVKLPATPKLDGKDFAGDLCGFVRGGGAALHVVGVAAKGAYVFTYDLGKQAFSATVPAWIPHPSCSGGKCPASLDAGSTPWPCRGARVEVAGKDRLYLVDFKGAGSLATTGAYQLAVVDLAPTGGGTVVSTTGPSGFDGFLDVRRIFRGVVATATHLYLLEPSWSKRLVDDAKKAGPAPAEAQVVKVPFLPTGAVDWKARTVFSAGIGDDTCGSTNKWPPAFGIVPFGGGERIAVGTDTAVGFFDLDGAKVGEVAIGDYGKLATSLAVAPDGKSLYVMPNCKSATKKAKVLLGVGKKTTDLDRHATAVFDLTTAGAVPALRDAARDFDADGTPDGGIDMEFLHLKRDLLRWCEQCTGVVPPTAYTGPGIAVGQGALFLKGTGAQSTGKNSAGLGQAGDLSVFDLATGKGLVFRKHSVWLDGPSARWGVDMRPENATKTYDDDVSVGAFIWVAK